METLSVRRLTSTRIPTIDGEFTLSLYENSDDDKDHLALLYGDVEGADNVLVRVHSECFTGDVLGSLRCDCGQQLNASLKRIASEDAGVLLYLRQEGRGIGLLSKLKAYDLQDEGYDTVEANLMLGHGADERDYSIGAHILRDLNISSVRLLTNNPEKIESLENNGITVEERVPLEPSLNRHNSEYLRTKADRMRHLLDPGRLPRGTSPHRSSGNAAALRERAEAYSAREGRPFVTLTYAQSLDGSIASAEGEPMSISGSDALEYTHRLRAYHDAILVGIGTVLADDPRLNVRRTDGEHPQPVILDSELRFPTDAQLLSCEGPPPLIVGGANAPRDREKKIEEAGADVIRLDCDDDGVCLPALLDQLAYRGIRSVMVEGGTQIISSFLRKQLVNRLIVTVAPSFIGGKSVLPMMRENESDGNFPRLQNLEYRSVGNDIILEGDPVWSSPE